MTRQEAILKIQQVFHFYYDVGEFNYDNKKLAEAVLASLETLGMLPPERLNMKIGDFVGSQMGSWENQWDDVV